MTHSRKKSLTEALDRLEHLPNRSPEMAFSGGAEEAFAEVSRYRDGAIFVGFYSGSSEWERHPNGEEIVLVLEGSTTLVLFVDGAEERSQLEANELVVVPANTWHRFERSSEVKIMTVTPQPTEHRLEMPDL